MSKILGMDIPRKSLEEVRHEARQRSDSIFTDHETLKAILERHEATIQSRWTKKKRQQKLDILDKAWPKMAKIHRPDFSAFKKESAGVAPRNSENFRDWYMWPYINQEDLMKPKALLLLINSRGRHCPSEFAAADFEAINLGLITKKLVPVFLNAYTMILHGASDRDSYGKLLWWEDHPDAFEWTYTRKQFMPGEGLIVLEAQERIMKFLVHCCQQILHDIPTESLGSGDFQIQPEPVFKSEETTDGFESLATMVAESPYRLPAKIDFDQIVSLLSAAESAAEDHIWSLREDPGYFSEQVAENKEHRHEILPDTDKKTHPTLQGVRHDVFLSRMVGSMITSAFLQFEFFSELRRQAQSLQSMYQKYAPTLSSTDDLPEDFTLAIIKFQYYLHQAVQGPCQTLKIAFIASPPVRKYFVRASPPDAMTSKMDVMPRDNVRMSKVEAEVLWLLRTMWENGRRIFFIKLEIIMDELDRLIQTEREAKEFLSPLVAEVVGQVSILSQCSHQLTRFLPWARGFVIKLLGCSEDIGKEYEQRTQPWIAVLQSLHEKKIESAARLCDPSAKRFVYPAGKKRTKENTQAMCRAEQNLDAFWEMIDVRLKADRTLWERTETWKILTSPRTIRRTAEWVDEPPSKANSKQQRAPVDDAGLLYKPLSNLFIGGQDKSKATYDIPKTKVKTKGQASQDAAVQPSIEKEETHSATEVPSIPVDARSQKVFRTLFYNPAVTSTPGEVSWADFVYAMKSTGLFSIKKLYGSVWQFGRVDGPDQSTILFHEPHPQGKIPFRTARRHGRRLQRRYGWNGETFTLEKK